MYVWCKATICMAIVKYWATVRMRDTGFMLICRRKRTRMATNWSVIQIKAILIAYFNWCSGLASTDEISCKLNEELSQIEHSKHKWKVWRQINIALYFLCSLLFSFHCSKFSDSRSLINKYFDCLMDEVPQSDWLTYLQSCIWLAIVIGCSSKVQSECQNITWCLINGIK